jgi:hypothetical protein
VVAKEETAPAATVAEQPNANEAKVRLMELKLEDGQLAD